MSLFERLPDPRIDRDVRSAEQKLNRLTYRLSLLCIAFAAPNIVLFIALGITSAALVAAAATVSFGAAAVVMYRGHHGTGRLIQHSTGVASLALIATVLGPEVNGHFLLLLAATTPPVLWTLRERIERWIHFTVAFGLWALLESGVMAPFAVAGLSEGTTDLFRAQVGLLVFAVLTSITLALIRDNRISESQLEAANHSLEEQVHHRQTIEDELGAARDVALQANRAKDDFLATMSHEIRTPMNTIIGLATMCSRSELSSKVRDYIIRIRSSSQALLGIINDIVDLSRIERHQVELEQVTFHLRQVLEHLTDLVGDSASRKGLEFLPVVESDVPQTLIGDPLRLGQVLTNLANNAVKFTDEGAVVVRVSKIGGDDERVQIRFSVEDTGIGIDPEVIDDLFESFVQADGSTTRRFGGSGLGLTISKSLVELMEGEIRAESEIGSGSRFSFVVDLKIGPDGSRERLTTPPQLGGLRVLVAHPNPAAGDVLGSMLSDLSISARIVADGTECLAVLARAKDGLEPYGLVLVNWPLPDMNAVELAARLADDDELGQIPSIIMVTAKHRDEALSRGSAENPLRSENCEEVRDVASEGRRRSGATPRTYGVADCASFAICSREGVSGRASRTETAGDCSMLVKPIRRETLLEAILAAFGQESSAVRRRTTSSGFLPAVHRIQGRRILVAEDNEGNRIVAREILEDAGLEVEIVNNGQQAIEAIASGEFDLVLMDVHMPVLDGPTATAELRREPKAADLPIIAMTADTLYETRERCFDSGMTDFVSKPIEVPELLSKLVRWIDSDPEGRSPEPDPDVDAAQEAPREAETETSSGPLAAVEKGQEAGPRSSWFSHLIGFGLRASQPGDLVKRLRLANGLALVLTATAAAYTPIYLALGLGKIAAITAAMMAAWCLSYILLVRGLHRSGRFLIIMVWLVGCTGYAFALGPRANYHALLFIGMAIPHMVFTHRERRLGWTLASMSVVVWIVVESQALASWATVEASAPVFHFLHANVGVVFFGFLSFIVYLLANENRLAERRLQVANDHLREEIEEREWVEQALVGAREAAEDAVQAKSSFLANMSHEIRTPMNAVLGLTDLCLRSELSATVRDQVTRIHSSAESLLRIINDILDLSRIEARKIELEEIDFDLGLELEKLSGLVGHSASTKGIEFLVAIDTDVPRGLLGDPLRLIQVLSNLTDNAVRFTEEGEILVKVERLGSTSANAQLRFSVTDTGFGIPEQALAGLFDPKRSRDQMFADGNHGPGLGLTISKNLVALMGGEIEVSSELGSGSTFSFTIELRRGSEVLPPVLTPVASLVGLRILVVAEHLVTRNVVTEMVSSCSFRATRAASASVGLEQARAAEEEGHPFDVVLFDVRSSSPHAIEDLREFVADVQRGDAAVIALVTAHDRRLVTDVPGNARAASFTVKPLRRQAVFEAILEVMGAAEMEIGTGETPYDLATAVEMIRGARILVAEDNEANQLVALGVLENAGFVVDLVGNGRDAVTAVAEHDFDLILMDLHMPQMDGYEATRAIRDDPRFSDLPIVAMTADAQQETRDQCAEAGMNGHVAKPVDRAELMANLVTWIEPREQPESTPVEGGHEPEDWADQLGLPENLAGIDVENALARMGGQCRTLAEVLVSFHRRFSQREDELCEAWQAGRRRQALELAHLVKGLAGNISAHDLFGLSASLEEAMRDDDDGLVPGLITEHRRLLQEVVVSCGRVELQTHALESTDDDVDLAETDVNHALPKLVALIALLDQRNLAAIGAFRSLQQDLDPGSSSAELQQISSDIKSLSFENAKKELLHFARKRGLDLDTRGAEDEH